MTLYRTPASGHRPPANFFLATLSGLCLFFLFVGGVFGLQAQQPGQWSPQARIPQYEDQTETPPFLIVDENMTAHVFNSQALELHENGSPTAVFYRQWSPEWGWTDPVDIILNPDGNDLELLDAYLDGQGVVHLLLQMANRGLYYSQADLALAGRATSWSSPVLLDTQATAMTMGIPFVAAISGDGDEEIVVLYSGLRDGNGMYALHSLNQGHTWAEPTTIYLSGDAEILPVAPKLAMGDSGSMHAVWSSFNADGSGGPGYYARLDMENGRWQSLVELDTPGIRTPNVIEYGDEIVVTYYHHNENRNWWRKSSDGGQTWSDPALIAPLHRGTNGFTSFAVDSANKLHLFFGQRIDDNNHGMWHTQWTGNGWGDIMPVVRGPQVRDQEGGQGFDPHSARSAILNGNRVLVTWVTDGFAGLNGAWYATTTLDAPELAQRPLLAPTPISVNPDTATIPILAIETPIPAHYTLADEQLSPNGAIGNPAAPILISLVPAIALIAGVALLWQLRRHR